MTKHALAAALGLALCLGTAHAADDTAKKPTAQQTRMTTCNQQAGDRKGDERKAFMSDCLKNKPAPVTQQDRMKACNVQAKDMKGDDRKAFMSDCLKKKA